MMLSRCVFMEKQSKPLKQLSVCDAQGSNMLSSASEAEVVAMSTFLDTSLIVMIKFNISMILNIYVLLYKLK